MDRCEGFAGNAEDTVPQSIVGEWLSQEQEPGTKTFIGTASKCVVVVVVVISKRAAHST